MKTPYVDELESTLAPTQLRLIGDVFVELLEVLPSLATAMLLRAEALDPGGSL